MSVFEVKKSAGILQFSKFVMMLISSIENPAFFVMVDFIQDSTPLRIKLGRLLFYLDISNAKVSISVKGLSKTST